MRVFVSRRVGPFRMGASFGARDFRRGRQAAYQQPSSGDHVYVVEGNGAVKIGVTGDLQARMAQLQTGSPYPLHLAYSTPVWGDAYAVEAEAHAMLGRHRLAGEWFGVPADVAVAAVSGAAYRIGSEPEQAGRSQRLGWLTRYALAVVIPIPFWAGILAPNSVLAFLYLFAACGALLLRGKNVPEIYPRPLWTVLFFLFVMPALFFAASIPGLAIGHALGFK